MDPETFFIPLFLMGTVWIVLHYITRWKTASSITSDDEQLLEELYQLARRLDERMDTVERLVAEDNPEFSQKRVLHDKEVDNVPLRELEEMLAEKKGAAK